MQIIKIGMIDGKNNGCEEAPNKVLSELKQIGSKENGELIDYSQLNLEEIHIDINNVPEADYLIFENTKEIFERNYKSLFIGGDHFISYPILRAFNKLEKNPLAIIFDAHCDCSFEKKDGNRTWLKKLIEDGFNPGGIILISARNIFADEMEFIKKNKMLLIKMDLLREDLEGVCDLVMERAMNSSGFYISIDIDSIDSGFAPGTFETEPGGLSSGELIYFVSRLRLLKNLKGVDITEINPRLDVNNITARLGARILAEIL